MPKPKRTKANKRDVPQKSKTTTATSIQLEEEQEAVAEKLSTVLYSIEEMTKQLQYVIAQVGTVQQDVLHLKSVIKQPPPPPPSPPKSTIEALKYNKGPFPKYHAMDRTVPRPSSKELVKTFGGKEHSLQFTSSLYIGLIEKAIGPFSESGLDYKVMVKETILITKAIVSHTKEENKLDPTMRWTQVDPTIKLDAYRKLEDATEHLLPLKTCAEYWGAHVLISNYWLKRNNKPRSTKQQHSRKSNAFSIPFLTNQ